MPIFKLSLNYKEESKSGVYIFTIYFDEPLYELLEFGDLVSFNAGEKKITAKIYNIHYFGKYNKYHCKEVEEK